MKFQGKYLVIIMILFITGCSEKRSLIDDLRVKNNIYYNKNDNVPFNGIAVSTFESGRIACEINLKDEIPLGEFTSYAQDGEVVQKGTYQPYHLKESKISNIKGIKRVNVSRGKEGLFTYIVIFVITNNLKLNVERANVSTYKYLLDALKSNDIIFDQSAIYRIVLTNGEIYN